MSEYGLLNDLLAFGIVGIMVFFTYVGYHMAKEREQGKYIPMFWEKKEDDVEGK